MSFRLFIYYCAVCGGCAAFVGWALGRLAGDENLVMQAGLKGLLLGLLVALGLSLVDALGSLALSRLPVIGLRLLVAMLVGAAGGLAGGAAGQFFYGRFLSPIFLIVGWAITGLLIGASVGVHDVLSHIVRAEYALGAWRKMVNGMLGGLVGGLVGGMLFLVLKVAWMAVFNDKPADQLWSPSATGFIALGMCVGLFIGLAQVILKEAWVRVDAGFRAGRQLILSKAQTAIGRAEMCDIGLFGDMAVERLHAWIVLQDHHYLLADAGTPGGTYLNGQRIAEPAVLRSGDVIQVGRSVLSFALRQKPAKSAQ